MITKQKVVTYWTLSWRHFDSFLLTTYKFGIIYTLVFRCFSICSNWTNFHNELVFLKDMFLKNGHPISFIDKGFKTFFGPAIFKTTSSFNCWKENLNTCSSFPRELSLQTRTKLRKILKRTLKETRNSYFCVTPKNHLMFVSWKN